MTDQPDLLYC